MDIQGRESRFTFLLKGAKMAKQMTLKTYSTFLRIMDNWPRCHGISLHWLDFLCPEKPWTGEHSKKA